MERDHLPEIDAVLAAQSDYHHDLPGPIRCPLIVPQSQIRKAEEAADRVLRSFSTRKK